MAKARMFIMAFCIFCVVLSLCQHKFHILGTKLKDSMTPSTFAERLEGEVTNIYFLKLGKAGSTTLTGILARYAWKWNLTVAIYRSDALGIETSLIMNEIVPPFIENESTKYNMILQHSSYEPDTIKKVLESPITHVTMMRNPLARLESHLHYFDLIKPLNLEEDRPAESLINRLDDTEWTKWNENELTRIYDYVNRYLKVKTRGVKNVLLELEKNFFIGITEFYDESLILLRHRLRWRFQDVLYVAANVQNYKHKVFNRELYDKLCQWIPDECLLYEHFNKSISQKIMQGNLGKEVKYFRSVSQKVHTFCEPVTQAAVCQESFNESISLVVGRSEWHDQFIYTYKDCITFKFKGFKKFKYLFYYRQNPRGPFVSFSEDDTFAKRIFNYWNSNRDLDMLKKKLICENL